LRKSLLPNIHCIALRHKQQFQNYKGKVILRLVKLSSEYWICNCKNKISKQKIIVEIVNDISTFAMRLDFFVSMIYDDTTVVRMRIVLLIYILIGILFTTRTPKLASLWGNCDVQLL
jgi:hypothetical protein